MYATGAEGVEAGKQARLVKIVVADAAGEGIPGPTARHARRAVVADSVDRRARACHRRLRRLLTDRIVTDLNTRADDTRFPPPFTTPLRVAPCSRAPLQQKKRGLQKDAARTDETSRRETA